MYVLTFEEDFFFPVEYQKQYTAFPNRRKASSFGLPNPACTFKKRYDILGLKRVCMDSMIHQICKDIHLLIHIHEKLKISQKEDFFFVLSPIEV